ncbi:hypothetical protein MAR_006751 [Mya arenaria]|uniref:Uncharacterized protein n=1 Tax=Mya arenaria TaxID=6604 RepID=A0ABY7DH06_MYAAR|nr:hypothetical protein MAR_006751 [Mya arenaria]
MKSSSGLPDISTKSVILQLLPIFAITSEMARFPKPSSCSPTPSTPVTIYAIAHVNAFCTFPVKGTCNAERHLTFMAELQIWAILWRENNTALIITSTHLPHAQGSISPHPSTARPSWTRLTKGLADLILVDTLSCQVQVGSKILRDILNPFQVDNIYPVYKQHKWTALVTNEFCLTFDEHFYCGFRKLIFPYEFFSRNPARIWQESGRKTIFTLVIWQLCDVIVAGQNTFGSRLEKKASSIQQAESVLKKNAKNQPSFFRVPGEGVWLHVPDSPSMTGLDIEFGLATPLGASVP